jgi:TrmH family RNA methyltransferase
MISKSQIKYIQSLGQKKYRDEEGVFIAEGPKMVKELLQQQKVDVKHVYGLAEWVEENKKLLAGVDHGVITGAELERVSQFSTPNKEIAVVGKLNTADVIDVKGKISLVLDMIQDPGNMGTIIRIADWFGITQIICSNDSADVYNPKVVQASMGSIVRVKVFYTDLLAWLAQQKEIRIYAAMLEGKNIRDMKPLKEALIMIGNESKGINEELLALANEKITIPRMGEAESLNAAVATGIILNSLVIVDSQ